MKFNNRRVRSLLVASALATALLVLGASPASARTWSPPRPALDQGANGWCMYYSSMQSLNMQSGRKISPAQAEEIARTAEAYPYGSGDEWQDVLASEIYRVAGIRTRHVHLKSANGILNALSTRPVQVAMPFYSEMYGTDSGGRWRPAGDYLLMNHGVVVRGYNSKTHRVLLVNQWGTWWGVGGTMWMSEADFRAEVPSGGGGTVWYKQ